MPQVKISNTLIWWCNGWWRWKTLPNHTKESDIQARNYPSELI